MKYLIIIRKTILFVSILALIGCTHSMASKEGKMLELGSALTKLSTAIESTVRYKNPPAEIGDPELLILATQHDPKLIEPFSEYTVRIFRQDRHAIVLVCTKDGKFGLLEDAGCSAELDKHLWKDRPARACEFTLSIQAVCGTN